MHPSEGVLRRSLDEPVAVDATARRHIATCARCSDRLGRIRADAARAGALFAVPVGVVDVDHARARLRATQGGHQPVGRQDRPASIPHARTGRVLGGIAVAAAASVLLVVSGGAQDFLSLFQPKQFAAVPVTSADIRSLAGLASYGEVNGATSPLDVHLEPDAAAAGRAAGLVTPVVSVPASAKGSPRYAVVSGTVVSFTFDAARARAAASRAGGTLPPMPRGLDGSTLTVAIAPAVVMSYGIDLASLYNGTGLPSDATAVVVIASRTPTVSSTGVTVQVLENYLLSLPGVPGAVVSELHAIGDPTQTVPVPIPIDLASASTVGINGVPGLLIGDSTEIGSVALWQHNGVVYAVAGTLSADQTLGIARSLH
jgi:hypothetical protein